MTTPVPDVAEAPRTVPRRGRPFTAADRRVLVAMTVAAAVLGILSPGAPTGQSVVDAVYRAAFVVAMTLAGSRARRWSLIVGAALATMASIGIGLVFAAVALGMTVLVVARRIRNRAFGACVGAFIAMACLRLDVDWFFGAETLVAVAASAPLLWSGYGLCRPRTRRIVRWIVLVGGIVVVAGVVLAGVQALRSVSDLNAAVASTRRAIHLTQEGKTADASKELTAASKRFGRVADHAGAWFYLPVRLVPVVAQNARTIPVVADAGRSLTEAAALTTGRLDYSRLRRPGGGIDLDLLAEFRDPIIDLSRRLHRATGDVEGVRSPWMLPPVESRLNEFSDKTSGIQRETDIASLAAVYGPSMFGADGPRRYLVLLGNPAEARDLGGHIGNFAELTIDRGVISLARVGLPGEVAQPQLDAAIQDSGLAPPSMLEMRPATFPQNWGTAVDFPTDARVASRLYSAAVGHQIDGVIYGDPFMMSALLSITGPVQVPDLNRSVGAGDAVKFFTLDQYSAFAQESTGDRAVTEFVRQMFDRLTKTTLPSPAALGRLFGPLVKEGRFRVASLHEDDHQLLGALGLDVGFTPVAGDDVLAVVTRNANPSKIDSYLHRSTKVSVRWDPATGAVRSSIDVTLRNDAPTGGLPDYVISNTAGEPLGTNVSDLAVVTPFEAVRATVDGVDAPVRPLWDGDVWRHNVRVVIPPGATRAVHLELEGDVRVGDTYRLRFAGQPMVNTGDVTINVDASRGMRILKGPGIGISGSSATARLTDIGGAVLTLKAVHSS